MARALAVRPRTADSRLRRHQPDQTPGEGFLQCLAREVVILRSMERHGPTGMVHGPGARAEAVYDASRVRSAGSVRLRSKRAASAPRGATGACTAMIADSRQRLPAPRRSLGTLIVLGSLTGAQRASRSAACAGRRLVRLRRGPELR